MVSLLELARHTDLIDTTILSLNFNNAHSLSTHQVKGTYLDAEKPLCKPPLSVLHSQLEICLTRIDCKQATISVRQKDRKQKKIFYLQRIYHTFSWLAHIL